MGDESGFLQTCRKVGHATQLLFFCSGVLFPPFLEGSLFRHRPVTECGGKGVALELGPQASELQHIT